MATFVLIPGAWHGSWCWEYVTPLLVPEGHTVLTPDLPGTGLDHSPFAIDVLTQWTDALVSLIEARAEPVVLVGHSRGGLLVSTVAERIPHHVALAVYLSAPLLRDGESVLDVTWLSDEARGGFVPGATADTVVVDPSRARHVFYSDVTPELTERAMARLGEEPLQPSAAKMRVSTGRFGSVPRAYIETTGDLAATPAAQREMQARWPCASVVSLACGHSSFYAMPARLARVLDQLSARPASSAIDPP